MSQRPTFPAAWWLRSLARRPSRTASLGLAGTAAMGLSGCTDFAPAVPDPNLAQQAQGNQVEMNVDTLELQRQNGWAVGVNLDTMDPSTLTLGGATALDFDGTTHWRDSMTTLATALAPGQIEHEPYYVPTLFQSLAAPLDGALRSLITPVHTAEMDTAFGRARAVLSLFAQVGFPTDTMVILDLPGADSVAAAAAMSARFDPIFGFGNWPHPLGVVPAQETLAAALYYQPLFARTRAQRKPGSPPVLVLDANRLEPYEDADNQFDNRYMAKIPSAAGLHTIGITHVLYVTPDGEHPAELDDLNESFIELEQAGIEVRVLGMSEIERSNEAPPEAALAEQEDPGDAQDEDSPVADEVSDDGWLWASAGLGWFWYFGGSPGWHCNFWHLYPWHRPIHGPTLPMPSSHLGMRMPHSVGYHPTPRATVFSGGQLHTGAAQIAFRPAHFGHVMVHTSRSNGHVVGFVGSRSGSFGRAGGHWGGG
jgi:hypothetical protein